MTRALPTLLLGVALCLAGAIFDSPSLYVPGLALGALAVVAYVWVSLAARGASLDRTLGAPTVVEEEPYPVRIRIRSGLLPPPGGEIEEPLLGWPVPVGGRWARRIRINVRFSRRGRRVLDPGRLVVRDPLGLHVRVVRNETAEELLVLPRTEPVVAAGSGARTGAGLEGDSPAGRALERSTAELEVDGLRPYREGAPASRIHWLSVARTGDMLERRLVADLDSGPLVVLDASRAVSEDALDRAVRAAASLCLHLARAGGCALLLPGERRPLEIATDLGMWPHAHARLAVVEESGGPPGPLPGRRGGAVLWVSAARADSIPSSLERATAAARYLVTAEPLPGRRAAFTVAGCTGHLLATARRGARAA